MDANKGQLKVPRMGIYGSFFWGLQAVTDEGYTLYLLFVLTWNFGCKYFFQFEGASSCIKIGRCTFFSLFCSKRKKIILLFSYRREHIYICMRRVCTNAENRGKLCWLLKYTCKEDKRLNGG